VVDAIPYGAEAPEGMRRMPKVLESIRGVVEVAEDVRHVLEMPVVVRDVLEVLGVIQHVPEVVEACVLEVPETVLHMLEMLEGMQCVKQCWRSCSMCWKRWGGAMHNKSRKGTFSPLTIPWEMRPKICDLGYENVEVENTEVGTQVRARGIVQQQTTTPPHHPHHLHHHQVVSLVVSLPTASQLFPLRAVVLH